MFMDTGQFYILESRIFPKNSFFLIFQNYVKGVFVLFLIVLLYHSGFYQTLLHNCLIHTIPATEKMHGRLCDNTHSRSLSCMLHFCISYLELYSIVT